MARLLADASSSLICTPSGARRAVWPTTPATTAWADASRAGCVRASWAPKVSQKTVSQATRGPNGRPTPPSMTAMARSTRWPACSRLTRLLTVVRKRAVSSGGAAKSKAQVSRSVPRWATSSGSTQTAGTRDIGNRWTRASTFVGTRGRASRQADTRAFACSGSTGPSDAPTAMAARRLAPRSSSWLTRWSGVAASRIARIAGSSVTVTKSEEADTRPNVASSSGAEPGACPVGTLDHRSVGSAATSDDERGSSSSVGEVRRRLARAPTDDAASRAGA
mmetsp:Transcript_13883/g.43702  ORF Transcript_13883/g.43702 Transcript_13883/m.43702 type:complete len:278 (+) Transcript_13883:102-935(+)